MLCIHSYLSSPCTIFIIEPMVSYLHVPEKEEFPCWYALWYCCGLLYRVLLLAGWMDLSKASRWLIIACCMQMICSCDPSILDWFTASESTLCLMSSTSISNNRGSTYIGEAKQGMACQSLERRLRWPYIAAGLLTLQRDSIYLVIVSYVDPEPVSVPAPAEYNRVFP